MNYVVGHNMPGYLPEAEVWVTSTFEDARAALTDDLLRALDDLADIAEQEGDALRLAHAEEAIADLKGSPVGPFLAYVGGEAYWIDETEEQADE